MTVGGWRIAGRWAREVVILAVLWTLFEHFFEREPWGRAAVGGVFFGICVATILLLVEWGYASGRARSGR